MCLERARVHSCRQCTASIVGFSRRGMSCPIPQLGENLRRCRALYQDRPSVILERTPASRRCALKGHEFTRAANAPHRSSASAAEGCFPRFLRLEKISAVAALCIRIGLQSYRKSPPKRVGLQPLRDVVSGSAPASDGPHRRCPSRRERRRIAPDGVRHSGRNPGKPHPSRPRPVGQR
jgi:hypothetical protein